jgi:hypothetical protein
MDQGNEGSGRGVALNHWVVQGALPIQIGRRRLVKANTVVSGGANLGEKRWFEIPAPG